MPQLNSKQSKTLRAIFTDPVPTNIVWSDIEKLFIALGAAVSQGRGSRVRVLLRDEVAVFHEPHPQKETDKGAVKDVRGFLRRAGIDVDL